MRLNIPIPSAGTIFLRYSTPCIEREKLVFQLNFLEERKHTPLTSALLPTGPCWGIAEPSEALEGFSTFAIALNPNTNTGNAISIRPIQSTVRGTSMIPSNRSQLSLVLSTAN
jgi:hypothetical protein